MIPAAPPPLTYDSPAALLRGLLSAREQLGVTRLADQTGLDRIGIACFAAIRPNSATVTTHQGKGVDPDSARISALMEAAEYHFAEAPEAGSRSLSRSDALAAGLQTLSVAHLMPREAAFPPGIEIDWLSGYELASGAEVLVARDCVTIGTPPGQLEGISQSTNGLAAGRDRAAALLHGLCEVIERDAVCLLGFRSDAAAARTRFAPELLGDKAVDDLVGQIGKAGFSVALYDQTTNIGVPVVYAVLTPAAGVDRHFDAATGAGCHPVAAVAAQRAIVEAAQTRISIIAGARDDIEGADYGIAASRDVAALANLPMLGHAPPPGLSRGADTNSCLAFVTEALGRAALERIVILPLGGDRLGIDVLRVFVPGLEDRLTNRHWRPGPRAARAMLGLG